MAIEVWHEPIAVKVTDTNAKSLEHRLERRLDPLASHSSPICPSPSGKFMMFHNNGDDRGLG